MLQVVSDFDMMRGGTVCDASMPTFLLTHWARDRAHGISLERVVQMQAHDTARFIGLTDRGTIELGCARISTSSTSRG